jgi:hypothetical protein
MKSFIRKCLNGDWLMRCADCGEVFHVEPPRAPANPNEWEFYCPACPPSRAALRKMKRARDRSSEAPASGGNSPASTRVLD